MHSYELEGRPPSTAALAGISVALVWLLDLGLSIFEYQPRCWMNLPCIGAFYSVLYLAFDHYIWKLGSLRSENNPLTQTNPVVPDRFRQDRWTNPGGNTSMFNLSETGSILWWVNSTSAISLIFTSAVTRRTDSQCHSPCGARPRRRRPTVRCRTKRERRLPSDTDRSPAAPAPGPRPGNPAPWATGPSPVWPIRRQPFARFSAPRVTPAQSAARPVSGWSRVTAPPPLAGRHRPLPHRPSGRSGRPRSRVPASS